METAVKEIRTDVTLTTFGIKWKTKIGFWNVRTMWETGKLKQVVKEMEEYKIDILGLSEARWTDYGEVKLPNDYIFIYSGTTEESVEHINGVGILINKNAKKSLMQWTPISDRMIKACFRSQCYAPTNSSDTEKKEYFYQQLHETPRKANKRDIIIIMGDMNANIGTDNEGLEHVMGRHAQGERNENVYQFLCQP
ncbi:hypothetical protein XELAEV_18035012mg [Xenopus laevis]|uniref:Endonuclease/exonuclease/phosphatase domain-containing protein n=1 Tax=Xenopus laevis TaxID=8355 RepID=A0A974CF62_XENLA|nr:hypothetical protein XELAEV_18035012mg [Xenopus laevis]